MPLFLIERQFADLVPTVPSLALGSGEVTLMSMTAAFGAFANHGLLFTPTLIRRVHIELIRPAPAAFERQQRPVVQPRQADF